MSNAAPKIFRTSQGVPNTLSGVCLNPDGSPHDLTFYEGALLVISTGVGQPYALRKYVTTPEMGAPSDLEDGKFTIDLDAEESAFAKGAYRAQLKFGHDAIMDGGEVVGFETPGPVFPTDTSRTNLLHFPTL